MFVLTKLYLFLCLLRQWMDLPAMQVEHVEPFWSFLFAKGCFGQVFFL